MSVIPSPSQFKYTRVPLVEEMLDEALPWAQYFALHIQRPLGLRWGGCLLFSAGAAGAI